MPKFKSSAQPRSIPAKNVTEESLAYADAYSSYLSRQPSRTMSSTVVLHTHG
jgi:hypothetical protein